MTEFRSSNKLSVTLVWWVLGILLYTPVYADVSINEVYPNPEGAIEIDEWIELFNGDNVSYELQGWQLDDAEGGSNPYMLPNLSIPAFGFVVIEQNQSGIKLNNSGDEVRLYDSSGSLMDSMKYGNDVPEAVSYGRNVDGEGSFSVLDTITKGSSNDPKTVSDVSEDTMPTSAPLSVASRLRLSEFRACPLSGEPEWVEIVNLEDRKVSTSGWVVEDAGGTRKPLTMELNGLAYGVVEWYSSVLNNSGDAVRLVNPDGSLVDDYAYSECEKNASWAVSNGSWYQTVSVTKGGANKIEQLPPPTAEPSKKQGRAESEQQFPEIQSLRNSVQAGERENHEDLDVGDGQIVDLYSTQSGSIAGIINTSTMGGSMTQSVIQNMPSPAPATAVPFMVVGGVMLIAAGGVPMILRMQDQNH